MTIDKAIRITKQFIACAETEKQLELSGALKLSVEALSFYQIMKDKACFDPDYLLPGETK